MESLSPFLWPVLLGMVGCVLFALRAFFSSVLFASVSIEELGSFMETSMEILKKCVWNKNWTIGRLSMTKISVGLLKLNQEHETMGLEAGIYVGTYRRRPVIVSITDKQLSGFGDWVPRHPLIRIWTLRMFEDVLIEFIREAKDRESPIDTFSTGFHSEQIRGRKRSGFEGIFLPGQMAEEIESFVSWFISKEGEDWYREMRQPYKLVLLLHGKAGAGKTALARAIADVTRRSLTHVRLVTEKEGIDISHETVAFVTSCKNDVILLDEIDKLFVEENQRSSRVDPGTLLGLLNGDLLDGQIIVLTANDLDLIPKTFRSSLLRSRRIDRMYDFTEPTEDQKRKACAYYEVPYTEEIAALTSMAEVLDVIMRERRQELIGVVVAGDAPGLHVEAARL